MKKNYFYEIKTYKKIFSKSIYGLLDQVFSSLLIFGINFYFAFKSMFNEVGIFAIVFSTITISQIIQQAILERPFLIKKNIFKFKIIVKRLIFIFLSLAIIINVTYFSDINVSNFNLNITFLFPWFFLGIVQLLFNLQRVYFYAVSNEEYAFLMSFISTILIFSTFLLFRNNIKESLTLFILIICFWKILMMLVFTRKFKKFDENYLIDDSSITGYVYLILISLSIFLKTRFPVFYLSEYAFILAGVYEMFRTTTEIILMPFRPISQTLISHFSDKRSSSSDLALKILYLFIPLTLSIAFLMHFGLSYILEIFNLNSLNNPETRLHISVFTCFSIICVPLNAYLLSNKQYIYELIVKGTPLFYLLLVFYYFDVNYEISKIIRFISWSAVIESILALYFFLFQLHKNKKFIY